MMSRVSGAMAVLACLSAAAAGQEKQGAADCRPSGMLLRIADLPEASGVAVGRRASGHLWAHNDSGDPVVFAIDTKGRVAGRVRISGASVEDWEAIATGPCGGGSCLYIADIGDNDANRSRVTVYRVPEPSPSDDSAAVEAVLHLAYPDGAHDAEALLIAPDGTIFIVTKGETGPVALYRAPQDRQGGTAQLERVGRSRTAAEAARHFRVTDGAISADGQWVALRTTDSLVYYPASEFLKGSWREAKRVDLGPLGEPQGEGVALGDGRAVYLVGEGGGQKQPGTFAAFVCAPGR